MGLKLDLSHKGRMFDWWWVQRKIFGSRREEVTAEWMQLHMEKFHGLYSSANMITTPYNTYHCFIRYY